MNAHEQHPARSAEFLSRLHDGELDAAERARFEAHRAHCAECRNAAAQLEEALAFFRSSRPRPPGPDLAARILRRLRASTPRRAPLGHAFGIDLKWAGAFAAALVAVIIGSTVILERERREQRFLREASIPVSVETRTDALKPAAPKARPSTAPAAPAGARDEKAAVAKRRSEPSSDADSSEKKPASPARAGADAGRDRLARLTASERAFSPAAPPADSVVAEAPAVAAPGRPAPQASAMRDQAPRQKVLDKTSENEERVSRARQRVEVEGGEGGLQQQQQVAGAAAPQESAPPIRIQILAPDGQGSAPEPSNAGEISLSAADRGEYVVIVRSDGTVASVREAASTSRSGKLEKFKEVRRPALDELKKLRFTPAGRPRHLVVKVE